MRGIREGDSCRVFAERILEEYPLNKKNVYVVNNLRIYRNLYGLNFYMGNIFHDFDKETPAKGYFLIGENEMEKKENRKGKEGGRESKLKKKRGGENQNDKRL